MLNRKYFQPAFRPIPDWPCPTCEAGYLSRISFHEEENSIAHKAREIEEWEPDWLQSTFVSLMKCSNKECREVVSVSGKANPAMDYDPEFGEAWTSEFSPVFIDPPISLFLIHEDCPEAVASELRAAFRLFWSDLASCASKIRSAVEAVMDDRKVPKTAKDKNGKKTKLTLHARIAKFSKKHPVEGKLLMAIKWLGNEGSHYQKDAPSRETILDGCEVFEHVVDLLYAKTAKKVASKAKKISKGKSLT